MPIWPNGVGTWRVSGAIRSRSNEPLVRSGKRSARHCVRHRHPLTATPKSPGVLRVPAQAGQGSGPMADTFPAPWRTVFRCDAGRFGVASGMLSAMPGTLSGMAMA
jgi:hypothetical protein